MAANQSFPSSGGTGSVTVTASPTGCSGNWTATSNDSWITITSGASGTGSGTVGFSVANYTGSGTRTGTLMIAGQSFSVTQLAAEAPACTGFVLAGSESFPVSGGTGSVTVTASPSGCVGSWTAISNDSWITITSGGSGSGNGTVNFTVASYSGGGDRMGTLAIAGQTFRVTQQAAAAASCTSFAISPANQSFPASGGTGAVRVTGSPAGCVGTWTATSNDNWITITSGGSGSGNGTVNLIVASYSGGGDRMGTVAIAGQTFRVTQQATAAASCTSFAISPANQSFPASGGTGAVTVTGSPGGCVGTWTATSNDNWITITSGGSGSGSGTVNFSVASYSGGTARTGTVTIAGQVFTVNQQAAVPSTCTSFAISPANQTFQANGGPRSVTVTGLPSGCAGGSWAATSNDSWITVTSGAAGSGSGTVGLSVATYASTGTRMGSVTIAGQTFVATQQGIVMSVSVTPQPCNDGPVFPTPGNTGVPNKLNCEFNASSSGPSALISTYQFTVDLCCVAPQLNGGRTTVSVTFPQTPSNNPIAPGPTLFVCGYQSNQATESKVTLTIVTTTGASFSKTEFFSFAKTGPCWIGFWEAIHVREETSSSRTYVDFLYSQETVCLLF
jgi:hypothetical protein